jgi:uncharacterized protein (TIGR02118 family)
MRGRQPKPLDGGPLVRDGDPRKADKELEEAAMIKVSVLYPYKEGASFNMDYYVNKHMPMVRDTSGPSCQGIAVEQGLSGPAPGSRPTYIAMGHVLYDSLASFQAVFAQHAAKFLADIPNYTTIEPVIQVSEVKA